jgi:hypothetical protein
METDELTAQGSALALPLDCGDRAGRGWDGIEELLREENAAYEWSEEDLLREELLAAGEMVVRPGTGVEYVPAPREVQEAIVRSFELRRARLTRRGRPRALRRSRRVERRGSAALRSAPALESAPASSPPVARTPLPVPAYVATAGAAAYPSPTARELGRLIRYDVERVDSGRGEQ